MRHNRIGFKMGIVIITLFLIVLVFLGFAIDRMFTNFYSAEMQKETEELTSHFTVMANATETTSEQTMKTFAEFSNVSIINILKNGKVILHSGTHDSADNAFIRTSDLQKSFQGKRLAYYIKIRQGMVILSQDNLYLIMERLPQLFMLCPLRNKWNAPFQGYAIYCSSPE